MVVFITITCADVSAQGTAQIHGTIRDASGAAVPGAEVKVTQTDTGVSRSVMSGTDGGFIVTNLATGPHQIEASKEGFSKVAQTGIVLQVNGDPLVEIALKVGAVNEQVSVGANASQVETRNSAVGAAVPEYAGCRPHGSIAFCRPITVRLSRALRPPWAATPTSR